MDPLFSLVLAGCVLGWAAAALGLWRSTPARVLRDQKLALHQVAELSDEVAKLRGQWVTHRTQLESVHEAILDDLDRAERKRRQAAAYRQRALAAEASQQEGEAAPAPTRADRRTQLRQIAHQRGMI